MSSIAIERITYVRYIGTVRVIRVLLIWLGTTATQNNRRTFSVGLPDTFVQTSDTGGFFYCVFVGNRGSRRKINSARVEEGVPESKNALELNNLRTASKLKIQPIIRLRPQ